MPCSFRDRWPACRRPAVMAGLVWLAAMAAPCAAADEHNYTIQDPGPPPFEVEHDWQYRRVRHTGHYEPLKLEWQAEPRVPGAANIFVDPHVPAHVLVATDQGLVETFDHGQAWRALPAAAADKVGPINSIAFRPDSLLTFYAASQTRGLWITSDGGKTFRQLASKATGLASDSVQNIFLYPADKLRRTFLLTHGEDAAGVSRSTDAGKSWQTLYPDYHISYIAFSGESTALTLVGTAVRQPDIRSIYYCPSPEEPWQTLLSDVTCTSAVTPVLPRDAHYFSTSDKGFLKISANGGIALNLDFLKDHEWASFGCTFGRTADSELYYAYDPKELGLVLFTGDDLDARQPTTDDAAVPAAKGGRGAPPPPRPSTTPYTTQSHGLFTGPMVMGGARAVANANGTVFYAVANKTLYVAQRATRAILVREVAVDPPLHLREPELIRAAFVKIDQALDAFSANRNLLTAADQLQPQLREQMNALGHITVTATVESRPGHSPKSVTVDLSRLGLSFRSPLFDDGRHGDGQPNDGVYANTFYFDSIGLEPVRNDWRASWPGTLGLTVSAVGDDGSLSGAVGVFTIGQRTRSLPHGWYSPSRASGEVKGDNVWTPKYGTEHRITPLKAGAWSVAMPIVSPRPTDISGCYALSFRIRAAHETTDDLAFQFQDSPTYAFRSKSDLVSIIKEGFLPSGKITTQFQRVTIPISRILRNPGKFDASTTSEMFISSTATGPQELFLYDVRICPTEEDVPTDKTGK